MKSRKFITVKMQKKARGDKRLRFMLDLLDFRRKSLSCAIFLLFAAAGSPPACVAAGAAAQKIAVIVPDKTGISEKYAAQFRQSLAGNFNVLDESLGEIAFRSSSTAENPFNLTTDEAKTIGAAIGCDYFVLIKSGIQRRSSFGREEFYESFAFVYVVSARSGRLAMWKPQIYEAETLQKAEKILFDSADKASAEIFENSKIFRQRELSEKSPPKIEEVPDENSPEAKNFRPPLPFKRFKPEYTRMAYVYDITATIDLLVDVDETGAIKRAEIVRWAGFGLDESVVETIRKMNWRPATRNGKALPMRVLLRYNFKKIEKEEI